MNKIKNFVLLAILIVSLLSITLTSCKKNKIEDENNPITIEVTLQNVSAPQDIVTKFNEYRAELADKTGDQTHKDDVIKVTVSENFSFLYTVDVSGYSNIDYTNIELTGNIYKFSIPAGTTDATALKKVVALTPSNGETITISGTPTFTADPSVDFSKVDLTGQKVHLNIGNHNVASTTELADIANFSPTDVDGQVNTTMIGDVTTNTFQMETGSKLLDNGIVVNYTDENGKLDFSNATFSGEQLKNYGETYGYGYDVVNPNGNTGTLTSNVDKTYITRLFSQYNLFDGAGRSISTTINPSYSENWVKASLGSDTLKCFNAAWMYEGSTEANPDTAYFHRYYESNQK